MPTPKRKLRKPKVTLTKKSVKRVNIPEGQRFTKCSTRGCGLPGVAYDLDRDAFFCDKHLLVPLPDDHWMLRCMDQVLITELEAELDRMMCEVHKSTYYCEACSRWETDHR